MAHTVAGVVIKQNDRYLMVQEKLEKCYGQWNWPAGWVDKGETPQEAAAREAKEEVGLDVTIDHEVGRWYDEAAERTRIIYTVKEVSGKMTIQESEILGAAWLSAEQISALRGSMRVQDWSVDMVQAGKI